MKKIILSFIVPLCTLTTWAHNFQVDGIYYNTVIGKTNEVAVTYRGSSYSSYDNEYSGSVAIPETVTDNGTTYSVTSIGNYAFYGCSALTSITIPNSVTSIGGGAFSGCSGLTSPVYNAHCFAYMPTSYSGAYTIPEGIKQIAGAAFNGCSALTSITIPNSVTSIGRDAFKDCSGLTSITIPESVTSIGSAAFFGCSSIASVIWNAKHCSDFTYFSPNDVSSPPFAPWREEDDGYGNYVSFIFGDSVEHIPAYLCYKMYNLTSIIIPNSVTSIGDNAFGGCSGLTSPLYNAHFFANLPTSYSGAYSIPNGIKQIAGSAFSGRSGLTSITIPESVTSIGGGAFFGCSSIASVVWNAKHCRDFYYDEYFGYVRYAPPFAPRREDGDGYGNYVSFTFGDSVEHVPAYLCYKMYNLTSVTIPNSVTTIGDNAFSGCSGLTSVTIGNSVPTIGGNAFRGCSGLTSITIPNSVTSIGYGAFADCSKLGKVILGSGLTEIEEVAFRECKKLYDIYCYAVEPPVAYINTFANYNVNLYIPCNNLKAYQMDALFGSFKYIQCIDSEDVTTNEVVITPGTTDVTITWPAESNADTYTLVIMKDGEVVCTLTFNSEGQLLNIAFAPGREGNHPAQYAEQSANGYRFTVTGLEEGTHYTYNIDIKNAANKTIKSHSGKFTTESLTAVENTHSKSPMTNCPKLLRNGQLIILRDGKTYNAQGTVVK